MAAILQTIAGRKRSSGKPPTTFQSLYRVAEAPTDTTYTNTTTDPPEAHRARKSSVQGSPTMAPAAASRAPLGGIMPLGVKKKHDLSLFFTDLTFLQPSRAGEFAGVFSNRGGAYCYRDRLAYQAGPLDRQMDFLIPEYSSQTLRCLLSVESVKN